MSLHDAYARITPFELAVRDEDRASELVDAATEEAEARGVDLEELDGFLTLGAAAALVGEIAGEAADPGALHRFGPLAYHAVRFASVGRSLYVLSTHAVRYLVEGAPDGEPTPPSEAGYLQLPQHLFWTRAAEESPESVDGVFWSTTPSGLLHTLLVTGIRPDRPGLGVVPLPPGPLDDAAAWLELAARGDGDDFATDLPGAELDALYEIRTAGEVFKLLGRFFAHMDASPDAVGREQMGSPGDQPESPPDDRSEPPPDDDPQPRPDDDLEPPSGGGAEGGHGRRDESVPDSGDGGSHDGGSRGQSGPRPSALPFRRVTLGAG